jgi:hypothetical protein
MEYALLARLSVLAAANASQDLPASLVSQGILGLIVLSAPQAISIIYQVHANHAQ